MRIEDDIKLDYSDVLIRPKRSTLTSRYDVDMNREFTFMHSGKTWKGVPIMAANMDTVGTPQMHQQMFEYNMITCPARHYMKKDATMWRLGTTDNKMMGKNVCMMGGIDDTTHMVTNYLKWEFVGIDVANGYTISVIDAIKDMRMRLPDATIVAGNVVTADMTQELILAGADIVKVGVGPGSVCTTRVKTGVGYPQLSTIIECSDAAHGLGGHIISDGGCTVAGDIAKAFGGGADFVMLGGMLAGHDEGGGEIVDNKVQFYGMSSRTANEKHFGGLRDYRAAEGKTVEIPYRGKIINTVQDILGGLRSACTYSGARRLKDLCKCTTFIRTTVQENKVYS